MADSHQHGRDHATERIWKTVLRWLRLFGPGVVAGAADDDPSGIGTYAQAGAQFGFNMLWTTVLTFPFLASIQEVAARIGLVTGRGLAGNIRRNYPAWLLYLLVGLLVVANTINIGANVGAMGAAAHLVLGGPAIAYSAAFVVVSIALEILVPYHRYAKVLLWSTVVLLSYVGAACVVGVPWATALKATLLPAIPLNRDSMMIVLAVFGTTISPYLFFWQASQEVEEEEVDPVAKPLLRARRQAPRQLHRVRVDTLVGMAASNIIAWFIIVTTAATLNPKGVLQIDSPGQAAMALAPIAGRFASSLFAIGIIGTGLHSIPILAGSASYAVCEALDLPIGLERRAREARAFYGIIAAAMLVGLAMDLTPVDPMRALVYAAVINGIAAVPIMVMMMLLGSDSRVMKGFRLKKGIRVLGWVATGVMAAAAIGTLATFGKE